VYFENENNCMLLLLAGGARMIERIYVIPIAVKGLKIIVKDKNTFILDRNNYFIAEM
jgi:hypothetical protein